MAEWIDYKTEASVVADLSTLANEPITEPEYGHVVLPEGGQLVAFDHEKYLPVPWTRRGEYVFDDAESFAIWTRGFATPTTIVYRRIPPAGTAKFIAVIDEHADSDSGGQPKWGELRAMFSPQETVDWKAWKSRSGTLSGQEQFAEFIEDHVVNIVVPSGAEMLEIAQSFHASLKGTFNSDKRIQNGLVQFTYAEEATARAGGNGQFEVPSTFTIQVAPYEGSPKYQVNCRLRWRLNGGKLTIGYVIDRADIIERDALDKMSTSIGETIGPNIPILNGVPRSPGRNR